MWQRIMLILGLSWWICVQVISSNNVDSLKLQLELADTKEEKIAILLELSSEFKQHDKDKALIYAQKGYEYAKDIGTPYELWEASYMIGELYYRLDSLAKALEYANRALIIIQDTRHQRETGLSYLLNGMVFSQLYDYEVAGQYLFEAQRIFEEGGWTEELSNVYNSIGYMYYDLSEFDKALEYYKSGLEYSINNRDSIQLARALNNLAAAYEIKQKYEEAYEYFRQAYLINTALGRQRIRVINQLNLGIISMNMSQVQNSLEYLFRALELNDKIRDDELQAGIYVQLSRAHEQLKNYDSAYSYAFKAYELAKAHSLPIMERKSTYRLYSYFSMLAVADSANHYGLKYYQIDDSLKYKQHLSKVSKLEMQYAFKKQQQTLKFEQEKQDLNRVIVIGSLVFILIIFLLSYARLRIRIKNNRLIRQQLEKDLELRNKELATGVMYSIQKNKVLTDLTEELLNLEESTVKDETRAAIQKISERIQNSVDANAWEEFEIRFQQVHTDFYESLNRAHPGLTPNEKRICAFLRLDMSTKDISRITGQNVSAVEMARIRLRKKLGISHKEISLHAFLSKF